VGYPGQEFVLNNVSLGVRKGQFTCLLGPNGAGKSTLLKTFAGIMRPSEGEVSIQGAHLSTFTPQGRARRIGFLPQEIQPHFSYRVSEAVALGARVAGHGHWFETQKSTDSTSAVERALNRVNALELFSRPLDELSGGERRLVLVASVLAQEPDWLLLDEPAAMLDLHHQASLFRTLRRLAHEDDLGILCVTHDFNLAANFADEVVILHNGAIHARGPAGDVFTNEHLGPVFGEHFELIKRDPQPAVVLPK
jgi:iron complex transport system ATP-binding protein